MKNSKQGFTLAEVLITLGIIGVVAAITMPMLIGHYNKQVWVNQLKKTVSTLENGVKLMMAEDGVDWLYETSAWSYVPLGGCSTYSSCTNFHENLKKYFNATYTSVVNNSQLSKSYLYLDKPGSFTSIPMEMHLANGADIGVYWISKTPYVGGGWQGPMPNLVDVIIDVNGLKKEPNKLGRDVFIYAYMKKARYCLMEVLLLYENIAICECQVMIVIKLIVLAVYQMAQAHGYGAKILQMLRLIVEKTHLALPVLPV